MTVIVQTMLNAQRVLVENFILLLYFSEYSSLVSVTAHKRQIKYIQCMVLIEESSKLAAFQRKIIKHSHQTINVYIGIIASGRHAVILRSIIIV